jgi:hypothetical protein
MAARSFAVRLRQAGYAAAAASMASRVSTRPNFGTAPMISPVAGSSTAMDAAPSAARQRPLM